MPTILTFGDSNTYGTTPMRNAEDRQPRIRARWPVVMANTLGWSLVEEGLPGRTTRYPSPIMGPHMDGRIGLFIALESHGPIDALTIMLGTNDLKVHFDATPQDVADGAAFLLDVALSDEMQARHGGFEPILIAPPRPFEAGPFAEEFAGADEKGARLADALRAVAEARDIPFFDANSVISCSEVDGIHFDADAHGVLGRAMAAFIQSEIADT